MICSKGYEMTPNILNSDKASLSWESSFGARGHNCEETYGFKTSCLESLTQEPSFFKLHQSLNKSNSSLSASHGFLFVMAIEVGMSLFPDLCHAISVDALRVPLQEFKAETFSWMFGVKVAFVAAGAVMSAAKMSLTPFGIGAGAFAGMHLMEKYIGDGASALI